MRTQPKAEAETEWRALSQGNFKAATCQPGLNPSAPLYTGRKRKTKPKEEKGRQAALTPTDARHSSTCAWFSPVETAAGVRGMLLHPTEQFLRPQRHAASGQAL